MPAPLLIVAGGIAATVGIAGFVRSLTAPKPAGDQPGLTAAEFRESEVQLEAFNQLFQQERALRLEEVEAERFEVARRQREEDIRRQEQQRLEDQRREDLQRAEALRRENAILAERARLEQERLEEEARLAREKFDRDAGLARQAAQARQFEAFARSLPAGHTPILRPDGTMTSLPPGGSLSAEDVRLGADPLPFSPSPTTASRITQVPGVFVGANFRFKTIVEAQEYLLEAALKAKQGRGRTAREGVSSVRPSAGGGGTATFGRG